LKSQSKQIPSASLERPGESTVRHRIVGRSGYSVESGRGALYTAAVTSDVCWSAHCNIPPKTIRKSDKARSMRGFKQPDFAERQKTAQQAKQDLLSKFRSRPGPDDPEVAKRRAEREAVVANRERIKQEKEAAKAEQARLEAEAAAAEAARIAREKEEAEARQAALEAEQKAKRDARYAARKARGKKK
jgi:hypothetical protein